MVESPEGRLCEACGSKVQKLQFQMRAADEAHTTIESCQLCPLDPLKVKFGPPVQSSIKCFRRIPAAPPPSPRVSVSERSLSLVRLLEVDMCSLPEIALKAKPLPCLRSPLAVILAANATPTLSYYYASGAYEGIVCEEVETRPLSPFCKMRVLRISSQKLDLQRLGFERHGDHVRTELKSGETVHFYSRNVQKRHMYTAVLALGSADDLNVTRSVSILYSLRCSWENMYGFMSYDNVAKVSNLSPRAWDNKRVQKRGATYTPKVDGERAYFLVYPGSSHMFLKSKGYPHAVWKAVGHSAPLTSPVIIDVENVETVGCFFIDMLTDSKGVFSPRSRSYQWSLLEFEKFSRACGGIGIISKPSFSMLKQAEEFSKSWNVPTDGVMGLWPGTTTARKMKLEKSIELLLNEDRKLITSEGEEVLSDVSVPEIYKVGDIVELRFTLHSSGKKVVCSSMIKRRDKAKPNSTSAVNSILSSFNAVQKSDDARRSGALMWCESLRNVLLSRVSEASKSRKVILDVGTGSGQSLDSLSSVPHVAYILVEPDRERCETLRKRAGVKNKSLDPREILSVFRKLKSGSQKYFVLNCKLSDITEDEGIMKLLSRELLAVTAFFSAHYVLPELYDLHNYWCIPVAACFYPYDGVEVGGDLINCLGVRMRRASESTCKVKWGGDEEYEEPFTTVSHYRTCFSIRLGSEVLQLPSKDIDHEVHRLCERVYVTLPQHRE